jgi:hypothetical protein
MVCLFVLGISGTDAVTPDGHQLGSPLQKECKKAVKQLKKEGWIVSGASQSLETVMTAHYAAVEEVGAAALVIEGHGVAKSLNVAVRKAMSDATRQYASMRESDVESSTTISVTNEVSDEVSTQTKTDASYMSMSKQKVKAFTPTVTLYRERPDGSFEAKALYVVGKE